MLLLWSPSDQVVYHWPWQELCIISYWVSFVFRWGQEESEKEIKDRKTERNEVTYKHDSICELVTGSLAVFCRRVCAR